MLAPLPHCPSCSCVAAPPSTFVSDVGSLPVDLGRMQTYEAYDRWPEKTVRTRFWLNWRPDRYHSMLGRAVAYEAIINSGEARNLREAVKMLAVARRHWHAEETATWTASVVERRTERSEVGARRYLALMKTQIRAAGGVCTYCGDPNPNCVDHMLPASRGGHHHRTNLALRCIPCNSQKGNRTPEEWKADRLAAGLPWPPLPRTSRKAS